MYCDAKFGISCAQEYRLLDVARVLGAIQAAVAASDPSADPALAALRHVVDDLAVKGLAG
ncbi:hypothetical protein AQJ43_31570 [Streptomyces avermitilis]|uniref:Uncharacterized protein n=2 Tax=Streptomyces avermitilis TaxID=33903 RepID=Q82Q76_STRAW|nr:MULTISPECIES: hypothetical protein [Streptomyces]KUN50764.1 hypothetical protein AQJ43_31570 [Streptomyces avermitilis]MYS96309.1 hypothetical protein [Streptomyces sp. SID5469]OOV12601.1 hypothetical protein SM007_39240 [Streptomyces avermitilis]BAC68355.1 hypothetical protein SAVERM_645 [Streptomyces avermitilis MA-4680 = NBRC 14893]BBJ48188.1 hypothetical protein SAVMC3_08170 [Streptomyces avermitilis]